MKCVRQVCNGSLKCTRNQILNVYCSDCMHNAQMAAFLARGALPLPIFAVDIALSDLA